MPVRRTRIRTSESPGAGRGTSCSHGPGSALLLTSAFISLQDVMPQGRPPITRRREAKVLLSQGRPTGYFGPSGVPHPVMDYLPGRRVMRMAGSTVASYLRSFAAALSLDDLCRWPPDVFAL